MSVILRRDKGFALTFDELDDNFQALSGTVTVSPNPPENPVEGFLWFDNSDTNEAGLFVYNGTYWIKAVGGGPAAAQANSAPEEEEAEEAEGAAEVSPASGAYINGLANRVGPLYASSMTSVPATNGVNPGASAIVTADNGTLTIPADFWIWSDDNTQPALILDVVGMTLINNGVIIGKGGAGGGRNGNNATAGSAGGQAINITASGIVITNNAGAYIAGGGGGGGGSEDEATNFGGGGGGAGGGAGGSGGGGGALSSTGGDAADVVHTSSNADGNQVVTYLGGHGGGAGGGGGTGDGTGSNRGSTGGGGGGRILPGVGGTTIIDGGSAGNAGQGGSGYNAGGGGGWGAAGGGSADAGGGAGGAAISSSNAITLTDNGTIYGSTP
tara:strand:+ start:496 stop:1650 length:1155 start_codon:yes stop_codon:yes gene_type:complete